MAASLPSSRGTNLSPYRSTQPAQTSYATSHVYSTKIPLTLSRALFRCYHNLRERYKQFTSCLLYHKNLVPKQHCKRLLQSFFPPSCLRYRAIIGRLKVVPIRDRCFDRWFANCTVAAKLMTRCHPTEAYFVYRAAFRRPSIVSCNRARLCFCDICRCYVDL